MMRSCHDAGRWWAPHALQLHASPRRLNRLSTCASTTSRMRLDSAPWFGICAALERVGINTFLHLHKSCVVACWLVPKALLGARGHAPMQQMKFAATLLVTNQCRLQPGIVSRPVTVDQFPPTDHQHLPHTHTHTHTHTHMTTNKCIPLRSRRSMVL